MNLLITSMIIGLAGFALAEPPVFSGYNYNRPIGGGGFGGGLGGGFGGGGGRGGGYTQVSPGFQTNEGAFVDSALLEQIRQILLKEELQSQSTGGFGGGSGGGGGYPSGPSPSYGVPSLQYGAPSQQYGAPSYQTRVVGIEFESIKQGIQVAQFNQITQERPLPVSGGFGGGFGASSGGGFEAAPSTTTPPARPFAATLPPSATTPAVPLAGGSVRGFSERVVPNMPNPEAIKRNKFPDLSKLIQMKKATQMKKVDNKVDSKGKN